MLECGHQLGPYRIERLLEQGGMAAVYRAHDTRLERLVAIKVVHRDPFKKSKLRERFDVEARAISGLSHPNICRLFDIGTEGDTEFLVLEYLEGETLADRLDRGPLPFEECFRIAIDMAEALDHAHRRGILHRDIKPSNIMLTTSGARLMDFGVAKLLRPSTDSGTASKSQTLGQLTEAGKIVGTYDYMAPEQLEGKDVDARTDIFSLGAVIYEMATRDRALKRAIGAVFSAPLDGNNSSDPSKRKTLEPQSFGHVVETCLAENPEERWQSARDLANELRWIRGVKKEDAKAYSLRRWRGWIAAIGFVSLCAAVLFSAIPTLHRPNASDPGLITFPILAPPGSSLNVRMTGGMIAVSPDGFHIAFVATQSDIPSIWVRSLADSTPVRLSDTQGASYPFWSTDNRSIAFFAGGKLKIVDITGSPAVVVCDAPDPRGGSWSENGTILFSPEFKGGLYSVTLQNKVPRPVTQTKASSFESHRWPSFLPDGKHFLFTVLAGAQPGIYVGDLDEAKWTQILPDSSRAEYSGLGYLLFDRDDSLVAQRFSPAQLHLSGEVRKVARGIPTSYGYAAFSSSENGLVAYRAMGSLETQLAIYDKTGSTLKAVPIPADDNLYDLSLSPNKERIAFTLATGRGGSAGIDVWIYEIASGRFSPLTNNGVSATGIWNPTGTQITFCRRVEGNTDLFETELANQGATHLLYHSAQDKVPLAWSHDGKYLVYFLASGENNFDFMVMPVAEPSAPYLFMRVPMVRPQARVSISPDDRWIAFASSESGIRQVYVTSFPKPRDLKYQVSVDGGGEPSWDESGHTLYFLNLQNRMMKTDLSFVKGVTATRPAELFRKQQDANEMQDMAGAVEYVLMADGPRFLLRTRVPPHPAADVEVLVNFAHILGGK